MTIAIETKYLGATNTKGSRVSARRGPHRVTVNYDCGLSALANHARAAMKLAEKQGWTGDYFSVDHFDYNGGYIFARSYTPDDVSGFAVAEGA